MSALSEPQQWALVAKLVERMASGNQWAGETHIQKALYFLKSMLGVPCQYGFVLYKHGPYSFDLHDDLGRMRADMVLQIEPRPPYGASFRLGDLGAAAIDREREAIAESASKIEFAVANLGGLDVRALERYATALYFKNEHGSLDLNALGRAIVERKPHIREEEARTAVEWINGLEERARAQGIMSAT